MHGGRFPRLPLRGDEEEAGAILYPPAVLGAAHILSLSRPAERLRARSGARTGAAEGAEEFAARLNPATDRGAAFGAAAHTEAPERSALDAAAGRRRDGDVLQQRTSARRTGVTE